VNLAILPTTTVAQIAEMLEQQRKVSDVEVYVHIEVIQGKPVAYVVREPRIPVLPNILRKQAT